MFKEVLFLHLFLFSYVGYAQHGGNVQHRSRETKEHHGNEPASQPQNYQPDPVHARALNYNNSELLLDVNILMNAKADYQVAIFSLREERATILACQDSMQRKINLLTQKLLALGIPANYIYVDVITQVPILGYDLKIRQGSYETNEMPIGYELKKNIHVRYDEEKYASLIMDAAAQSGIYNLAKVDYVVANLEAINGQLRAKASEILKNRTQSYREIGIQVQGIIGLQNEVVLQYYPHERYAQYSAFNNHSLQTLSHIQGVSDNLTEGIRQANQQKHTTLFYDKIPYSRYDAVLNPELFSPTVQFIYQLQVRYRVKPN